MLLAAKDSCAGPKNVCGRGEPCCACVSPMLDVLLAQAISAHSQTRASNFSRARLSLHRAFRRQLDRSKLLLQSIHQSQFTSQKEFAAMIPSSMHFDQATIQLCSTLTCWWPTTGSSLPSLIGPSLLAGWPASPPAAALTAIR